MVNELKTLVFYPKILRGSDSITFGKFGNQSVVKVELATSKVADYFHGYLRLKHIFFGMFLA
jgi:hypothetical protein